MKDSKFVSYSINLGSYLKAYGIEINYGKDTQGRVFLYTDNTEEVRELVEQYKHDEELHSFLKEFAVIRTKVNALKSKR